MTDDTRRAGLLRAAEILTASEKEPRMRDSVAGDIKAEYLREEIAAIRAEADAGVEAGGEELPDQQRQWASDIMAAQGALYFVEQPMRGQIETALKSALEWAAFRVEPTTPASLDEQARELARQWRGQVYYAIEKLGEATISALQSSVADKIFAALTARQFVKADAVTQPPTPTLLDEEAREFTDEQLWPFVNRAGLTWCGRKDRETFIDDEHYFKANWKALPGLRAVVVEEAEKWLSQFLATRQERIAELEALNARNMEGHSLVTVELQQSLGKMQTERDAAEASLKLAVEGLEKIEGYSPENGMTRRKMKGIARETLAAIGTR